jgi:exonuclease III
MKNNVLQIVSYNCQGLSSVEKRRDVFDYLKSKNCNIDCLQDTHFTKNDETAIKNQWGGECIFSSFASNQRGVAILLSNHFEYRILNTKKDDCGNLLRVDIEIGGKKNYPN